jgi:hypothetical protein
MGKAAVPLAGLGALMLLTAGAPEMKSKSAIPRPRDGNIAIKQELCAARVAGTVAAYELFIARHPEHPLAETARKERRRLPVRASRIDPPCNELGPKS